MIAVRPAVRPHHRRAAATREETPLDDRLTRFACFLAVLLLVACWESLAPWRRARGARGRWPLNFGLLASGAVLVQVLLPVAAVGTAALVAEAGFGLFNALELPAWLEVAITVVLLDLLVYWQHRVMHMPPLWRLHRVHHADPVVDVSTGVRFHPLEILFSMLLKMMAVVALGPAPLAVLVFEVLLAAGALFTHANAGLPRRLDGALRWLLVTPDMHRVHHSQRGEETDSNFGFCLSCWDRLFGSYRREAAGGRDAFDLGLAGVDADRSGGLRWCLWRTLFDPRAEPLPRAAPGRR